MLYNFFLLNFALSSYSRGSGHRCILGASVGTADTLFRDLVNVEYLVLPFLRGLEYKICGSSCYPSWDKLKF